MALSANWGTRVLSVPITDLTFISPGVYSLTVTFWWQLLRELAGSEEGIAETLGDRFPFSNTPPQPGTPRITNLINNYTVFIEGGPGILNIIDGNTNFSDVRATPSDNFSVNTNNVAGFNTIATGSGVTQQDKDDIENQIFSRLVDVDFTFEQLVRLNSAALLGDIEVATDGSYIIKGVDGVVRLTGQATANGGRAITGRSKG